MGQIGMEKSLVMAMAVHPKMITRVK